MVNLTKMTISKRSAAVDSISGLGRDISRLVGEFNGWDLALQPNELFYDCEVGGRSYVKCKEFGIYSCMLGKNLHLNEWRVCRRTPKSYVVEYNRTIVICGHGYVAYKYRCMLPKYKNKMRRIFPFRRKTDSRELLRKLSERTYFILSCAKSIQTTNGDFYLDFSQINLE